MFLFKVEMIFEQNQQRIVIRKKKKNVDLHWLQILKIYYNHHTLVILIIGYSGLFRALSNIYNEALFAKRVSG